MSATTMMDLSTIAGVYRLRGEEDNNYDDLFGPTVVIYSDGHIEASKIDSKSSKSEGILGTETTSTFDTCWTGCIVPSSSSSSSGSEEDCSYTIHWVGSFQHMFPTIGGAPVKLFDTPRVASASFGAKQGIKGGERQVLQISGGGPEVGAGVYTLVRSKEFIFGPESLKFIETNGRYVRHESDLGRNSNGYFFKEDNTFTFEDSDGGYMGSYSDKESGRWAIGAPGSLYEGHLVLFTQMRSSVSVGWDDSSSSSDDDDDDDEVVKEEKKIYPDVGNPQCRYSVEMIRLPKSRDGPAKFILTGNIVNAYAYTHDSEKPHSLYYDHHDERMGFTEEKKRVSKRKEKVAAVLPSSGGRTGEVYCGEYTGSYEGSTLRIYPDGTWTSISLSKNSYCNPSEVPFLAIESWFNAARRSPAVARRDHTMPWNQHAHPFDGYSMSGKTGVCMVDEAGALHMTTTFNFYGGFASYTSYRDQSRVRVLVSKDQAGVLILDEIFTLTKPEPSGQKITFQAFDLKLGKYVMDEAFLKAEDNGLLKGDRVPTLEIATVPPPAQSKKKKNSKKTDAKAEVVHYKIQGEYAAYCSSAQQQPEINEVELKLGKGTTNTNTTTTSKPSSSSAATLEGSYEGNSHSCSIALKKSNNEYYPEGRSEHDILLTKGGLVFRGVHFRFSE